MAVRLMLSEVYRTLYAYGQELAIWEDTRRHRSSSELESLAFQKLDALDSDLRHCLLCYQAEDLARRGCLDGYYAVKNSIRRMGC